LVDLYRMAYPHKWSPISYKSSAGQRKHIGQRPMLYRWTTRRRGGEGQVERLHAKFHLKVFTVPASGGQKPQLWANFYILGAPLPTPIYRSGPYLVCYSRPIVYAYVPNFISIGLFCRPLLVKTPISAGFWTSAL